MNQMPQSMVMHIRHLVTHLLRKRREVQAEERISNNKRVVLSYLFLKFVHSSESPHKDDSSYCCKCTCYADIEGFSFLHFVFQVLRVWSCLLTDYNADIY